MERAPRDHTFKRRLSLKITAPYLFLSLVVGLAAIYLVAQMEAQALSDAFSRQLMHDGRPDSRAAARDQRALSLQLQVHGRSFVPSGCVMTVRK